MTKENIAALIGRLEQIATHDWRLSILTHTLDTAREAAAALKAQQDEIERLHQRVMALTPTVRSEPLAL